jgi:hypothetical protein
MSKFANKIIKKSSELKKKGKIQIKVKTKKKQVPELSSKSKSLKKKFQDKELIIIDETQGLIFENEKTLFGYFNATIESLEDKYKSGYNSAKDFNEDEVRERNKYLEETLEDPDEIWLNNGFSREFSIHTFVRHFNLNNDDCFFVACVYLTVDEKIPTFIFIQFATKDVDLLEDFRREEIIFHRKLESIQFAAIEGDSLMEGDFFAIGLLESMIKLRSEKDVPTAQFQDFAQYRDETINGPDEIWKQLTSDGHILVTFLRDISDGTEADLHYVVVTEEDESNQVHSLLFSFPTRDLSLLDRYRQGENLDADEVSTESSH